ncbi:hypothetical protein [Selenomonas sp. FC4001]|uniref:hypothetical protein n=1 Tax=Selenomonas sp. FC4001 TaxID=1408313 RepID=UPI00056BFACA|nr:hypothetical protein [Selenomonas sp. FC4001]
MNENNITSKTTKQEAAKKFGFITLGVIATVITAFAAKKAGYCSDPIKLDFTGSSNYLLLPVFLRCGMM